MKPLSEIKEYLRIEKIPHIWCPGCGHGIVLQAFLRAVADLNIDKNEMVIVSGIGCSSRSVGYMNFDTLHTAHGRALPFATGIKMAKPELKVAILAGDGDIAAIGGNHFIHTARRNIDLTTIIFNNFNYGMTGGQYSPLTHTDDCGSTAPYGNIESPFDMCALAKAAGATYIARSTTYHAIQLHNLIAEGIKHRGFSVIEVITGCPVCYGKFNAIRSPVKMLEWQRDHAVNLKRYQALSEEEKTEKFAMGVLYSSERPEYTNEYSKLVQKVQGKSPKGSK